MAAPAAALHLPSQLPHARPLPNWWLTAACLLPLFAPLPNQIWFWLALLVALQATCHSPLRRPE